MRPYIELSPTLRTLIGAFAAFVFIGIIVNIAQAHICGRKKSIIRSLILFSADYLIFQVCASVSAYYTGSPINRVAKELAQMPYFVYIIVLFVIFLIGVLRFIKEYEYHETHITQSSIKEASDSLSSGYCYYNSTGQPFLTNKKMSELALTITGKPLLDGFDFSKFIKEKNIREIGGNIYRFTINELVAENEQYYEIIADDVTEIYEKTKTLREQNERLNVQNQMMKDYGERITDIVRREEILKTKANIHDEMNKVLLQTDRAIMSSSEEERKMILETWKKNIFLLCIEAEPDEKENSLFDVYELSKLIGINVHIEGLLDTTNTRLLRLLSYSAQEAMTNAVKHSGAKNFYVSLSQTEESVTALFTNDGTDSDEEIKENGGLATLRTKIENVNGSMKITNKPFSLTVNLPLGDEKYV